MTITKTFNLTGEMPVQADYNTVTTGSIISIFYPFDYVDTSGTKYDVTGDTSLKSINGFTTDTVSNPTNDPTKTMDLPFDILFNTARVINGNVIIEGQFIAVGSNHVVFLVLQVERWDGTTATQLGSAQTESTTGIVSNRFILSIPISNEKIGSGDYIRINIEYWIGSSNQSSTGLTVAHNPKNDDITSGSPFTSITTSQLKVSVPFKIF